MGEVFPLSVRLTVRAVQCDQPAIILKEMVYHIESC
jgi:hypothetical protein